MKKPTSIEAYLAALPPKPKKLVTQLQSIIRKAAPGATEKLSYGMPTFALAGKNLVHVAGYEGHVGLYGARAMALDGELAKYQSGKGTLRFELDEPLPVKLVQKLIKLRVAENVEEAEAKKKARKR